MLHLDQARRPPAQAGGGIASSIDTISPRARIYLMIGEQQSISRHRDRSATPSVIIDTLAYHAGILYNVGLHDIRQRYAAHRENP